MWLFGSDLVSILTLYVILFVAVPILVAVGMVLKRIFPGRCPKCKTRLQTVRERHVVESWMYCDVPGDVYYTTVRLCPRCGKDKIDKIGSRNVGIPGWEDS